MQFLYSLHSECLKLYYQRATHIVLLFLVFFQSFLAFVGGKQILETGLSATPETNSQLAEAIPPIEYIGFDVTLFGIFVMIILGAIHGSKEYKRGTIRTSALSVSNRWTLFISKLLVWLVFTVVLSFVSIFVTIVMTHIALGKSGLPLYSFNPNVWLFILYATLSWVFLGTLSYFIALLFKNSVVSMLFLLPQVYNIGSFLATHFVVAKYLPVALGQGLIASSPAALTKQVGASIVILLSWCGIIGLIAFVRFVKNDIGGGE
ncbi:ABC transporter permease [Streptococcus oricebi]|uniref:ABC transporter permease n=2 Tax=Streptococcus oricebi TaxID=1547447 RepID=A0ABS5B4Q4_9STRE|nr:ABC transporter permease [Streptococcus oricebi]